MPTEENSWTGFKMIPTALYFIWISVCVCVCVVHLFYTHVHAFTRVYTFGLIPQEFFAFAHTYDMRVPFKLWVICTVYA